jgi:hypothetical protein
MTLHRKLLTALIAAILIGAGVVCYWLFRPDPRPMKFVEHWATTFQRLGCIEEIKKLSGADEPYLRSFPNGQWVAAQMEHACCDGAGFNASVYYDSNGLTQYDTTHCFCGYEGLCGELNEIEASDLTRFYGALSVRGIALKKWNASPRQP